VFNHVAVSVPDLEAAVDWYQEVFGFCRIRSDRATDRAETPDAPIFKIYPASMKKVKCAWLACGNGVGFEVFEFEDPKTTVPKTSADEQFEYTRGGFFHIAITVADPDGVVKKCLELGGKQIGQTVEMYGEKALYAADPWGNVIELLSCSFEQLMGNRS
jgi:catechol 2,3-dioxygenase-like lactoylglutathione lyase family enzyme